MKEAEPVGEGTIVKAEGNRLTIRMDDGTFVVYEVNRFMRPTDGSLRMRKVEPN
jgi:hypothetical protein